MAYAKTCDRCGKVIANDDGFYLYAYTQRQASNQYYRYGPHEESFDLCPTCYQKVIRLIKEGANG